MLKTLLLITLVAATTTSCRFKAWRPPARPCEDPMQCVNIKLVSDRSCDFPFQWNSGNLYKAINNHPTLTVILTYIESVRHINQVLQNESIRKTVRVPPGPTDSPALGCKNTGSEHEKWDIWSYTKESACFEGAGCPIAPKPTEPTETRLMSCEQECASNGEFCLSANLGSSSTEEQRLTVGVSSLAAKMWRLPAPASVDITDITSSLTALSGFECKHGPIDVSGNLDITSIGSECWLGIEVGTPSVSSIDLQLPSTLNGSLQRDVSGFRISHRNPLTSPWIKVFDQSNPPSEFVDRIVAIRGNDSKIMIESEKTYCVKLELEGG